MSVSPTVTRPPMTKIIPAHRNHSNRLRRKITDNIPVNIITAPTIKGSTSFHTNYILVLLVIFSFYQNLCSKKNIPLSIWKDDAYVRVKPMYCMDVAVISQSAGGKNMKGLNDLSCEASFSSLCGWLDSNLRYAWK